MSTTKDNNAPDYHLISLREPSKGRRRVTREFLDDVETHAAELRSRAGVGPHEKLAPRLLAEQFNVIIPEMEELTALAPEDREHLSAVDAKVWSGAGVPLPDGRILVLLNPRQTLERAAVTIMEEVAHVYLGHQPSRIESLPNGVQKREYDRDKEWEAYSVAAAAILPRYAVARSVWNGRSAESIATEYGASRELVEMRIKLLRLWPDHMGSRGKSRRAG